MNERSRALLKWWWTGGCTRQLLEPCTRTTLEDCVFPYHLSNNNTRMPVASRARRSHGDDREGFAPGGGWWCAKLMPAKLSVHARYVLHQGHLNDGPRFVRPLYRGHRAAAFVSAAHDLHHVLARVEDVGHHRVDLVLGKCCRCLMGGDGGAVVVGASEQRRSRGATPVRSVTCRGSGTYAGGQVGVS